MAEVLRVGDSFTSFDEIEEHLESYMKRNFVQLYKRNTRTIAGFKKHSRKVSVDIPDVLKYGEIDFCCIHGGKKFKSKAVERLNQRYVN